MLKEGQGVEIDIKSFPRPKIFDFIMKTGNINDVLNARANELQRELDNLKNK